MLTDGGWVKRSLDVYNTDTFIFYTAFFTDLFTTLILLYRMSKMEQTFTDASLF